MLDCHRREEVRFVVFNLCSMVTRKEEVRFVATNLCSIVIEGKKYDLLPPICARLSQKGRCMICCHQFVLDCHRREEIRFVAPQIVLACHRREEIRFFATNLCWIVTEGKKYDLLPPIGARLSQKGRSTICYHQFELDYHTREDLLPRVSQKGRRTTCCYQFVLGCHRREEVRFVATNLCSIVTEGKKYDLLPPICARLSQKGRNLLPPICARLSQRKKCDLLSPICATLSQKGRSTICCH